MGHGLKERKQQDSTVRLELSFLLHSAQRSTRVEGGACENHWGLQTGSSGNHAGCALLALRKSS